MATRTDLAAEAHAIWRRSAGETTALSGVVARTEEAYGIAIERVEILNREGENALGKPRGTYYSLPLASDGRTTEEFTTLLGEKLTELLDWSQGQTVLVVGLGNRAMTPDALGPMAVDGLLVTRHLHSVLPDVFRGMRQVCALCPGVLGTTGLESAEVVGSVVQWLHPDRVVVVDALAAAGRERLCQVVQLTDAGIVPGSGVGNSRAAFSQKTLGVPVVAVGVPTVMDAAQDNAPPLLVTPRDIDAQVARLSRAISAGLNRAFFPDWSSAEIAQFVE